MSSGSDDEDEKVEGGWWAQQLQKRAKSLAELEPQSPEPPPQRQSPSLMPALAFPPVNVEDLEGFISVPVAADGENESSHVTAHHHKRPGRATRSTGLIIPPDWKEESKALNQKNPTAEWAEWFDSAIAQKYRLEPDIFATDDDLEDDAMVGLFDQDTGRASSSHRHSTPLTSTRSRMQSRERQRIHSTPHTVVFILGSKPPLFIGDTVRMSISNLADEAHLPQSVRLRSTVHALLKLKGSRTLTTDLFWFLHLCLFQEPDSRRSSPSKVPHWVSEPARTESQIGLLNRMAETFVPMAQMAGDTEWSAYYAAVIAESVVLTYQRVYEGSWPTSRTESIWMRCLHLLCGIQPSGRGMRVFRQEVFPSRPLGSSVQAPKTRAKTPQGDSDVMPEIDESEPSPLISPRTAALVNSITPATRKHLAKAPLPARTRMNLFTTAPLVRAFLAGSSSSHYARDGFRGGFVRWTVAERPQTVAAPTAPHPATPSVQSSEPAPAPSRRYTNLEDMLRSPHPPSPSSSSSSSSEGDHLELEPTGTVAPTLESLQDRLNKMHLSCEEPARRSRPALEPSMTNPSSWPTPPPKGFALGSTEHRFLQANEQLKEDLDGIHEQLKVDLNKVAMLEARLAEAPEDAVTDYIQDVLENREIMRRTGGMQRGTDAAVMGPLKKSMQAIPKAARHLPGTKVFQYVAGVGLSMENGHGAPFIGRTPDHKAALKITEGAGLRKHKLKSVEVSYAHLRVYGSKKQHKVANDAEML